MLAKVLIIGTVAVAALAIEYPEGVDPAMCPNYPFCDDSMPKQIRSAAVMSALYRTRIHPSLCPNFPNCDAEVLKRHTPEGMPIPEWELSLANAPLFAADKYPPGVDPALCPNYPFCDMEVLARHAREQILSATAADMKTAEKRRRR